MFKSKRGIAIPNGLSYTKTQVVASLDLYMEGVVPTSIERFVVSTPLKHGLRCVYGSDLKSAISLLCDAANHYIWTVRTKLTKEKDLNV